MRFLARILGPDIARATQGCCHEGSDSDSEARQLEAPSPGISLLHKPLGNEAQRLTFTRQPMGGGQEARSAGRVSGLG